MPINMGAGRGDPIRTGDHWPPMPVRYQAALRPEVPFTKG